MRSKLFIIDWKDLARGFVTSFFTAVLTAIVVFINTETFPTNLEFIGIFKFAFLSGAAYLIKNFFTNSEDKIFKKEFKVVPIKKNCCVCEDAMDQSPLSKCDFCLSQKKQKNSHARKF